MKLFKQLLAIGTILGLLMAGSTRVAAEPMLAVSQPSGLRVQMQSELDPLAINQMHSWIIQVHNAHGEPINDALIRVDGGMPEHNHGLATSPQVTEALGDGRYRLEGMRFHMNGEWELRLQIEHAGVPYRVRFTLTL